MGPCTKNMKETAGKEKVRKKMEMVGLSRESCSESFLLSLVCSLGRGVWRDRQFGDHPLAAPTLNNVLSKVDSRLIKLI